MQLHVDTDTESVAGLMLLSRLLIDYANMKAQQDKALRDPNHQLAAYAEGLRAYEHHAGQFGTPDTRVTSAMPELAADFKVSAEPDPAVIFGKFPVPTGASPTPPFANVVPLFPQPALNLPGTTGPAPLSVNTVVPQGVSSPGQSTVTPAAAAPGVASAEVDSQGIPWDERIHSSSKKRKGDGTWILKRGVDHTLAQTITAQLMAAKLPVTTQGTALSAVPAAATAPNTGVTVPVPASNTTVTLPLGGASVLPVYVPPPVASNATPAGGVPLPNTGAVPIPGTPANGAVPVPEVNPVKRFGAMMAKVSQALGAKTITQQQVLDAHVAVGLQQLQQAVLNPDKIPLIEAALGLS